MQRRSKTPLGRRAGSAPSSASGASSGRSAGGRSQPAGAATTPFRVPSTASPAAGPAVSVRRRAGAAAGAAGAKPSKPRAGRERRERERSADADADADDELEHKLSVLSVAAPEFVPSFAPPAAPARSLVFVTARNPSKRVAGADPSSAVPSGTRPLRGSVGAADAARRPRRQRIGALGFKSSAGGAKAGAAGSAAAVGAAAGTAAKAAAETLRRQKQQADKRLLAAGVEDAAGARRPRSRSAGSDSDDEPFVEDAAAPTAAGSAFPATLSLFSQQKHIAMRASRDVVIDTIFDALFTQSRRGPEAGGGGARVSAFGDDTGTETDEPNEEFVKRGLAATLFRGHLGETPLGAAASAGRPGETPQQAVDRFVTPAFVHAVVTALRFEDFRTASARLDILRAVHKNCPSKRLDVARALADATQLRVEYVRALTAAARARSVEPQRVILDHPHDQGHNFTELLRYAVEHVGETLHGFGASGGPLTPAERRELLRNYMASLLALWRAHWLDPAGSDAEELISCAGQFVAYLPEVTAELLSRVLRAWPVAFPAQQVVAIRMCARVIMSGPPLPSLDASRRLQRRVFSRLAQAVQSPHVDVAKEALAFTGCQFVMMHFLATDPDVYRVLTQAFHANAAGHWHALIRSTSEAHFDRALDYAA